jgi:hypothetical protein
MSAGCGLQCGANSRSHSLTRKAIARRRAALDDFAMADSRLSFSGELLCGQRTQLAVDQRQRNRARERCGNWAGREFVILRHHELRGP